MGSSKLYDKIGRLGGALSLPRGTAFTRVAELKQLLAIVKLFVTALEVQQNLTPAINFADARKALDKVKSALVEACSLWAQYALAIGRTEEASDALRPVTHRVENLALAIFHHGRAVPAKVWEKDACELAVYAGRLVNSVNILVRVNEQPSDVGRAYEHARQPAWTSRRKAIKEAGRESSASNKDEDAPALGPRAVARYGQGEKDWTMGAVWGGRHIRIAGAGETVQS